MKRLLIIVLLFALIAGSANAEDMDFCQYTNNDLIDIIRKAQAELKCREITNILYDDNGIKLYLTGNVIDYKALREPATRLELMIENDSDNAISLGTSQIYINGWICGQLWRGFSQTDDIVLPHTKAKDGINLYLEMTDITSWNDITEFSIILGIYGDKGGTGQDNLITKSEFMSFPIIMDMENMTVSIGARINNE